MGIKHWLFLLTLLISCNTNSEYQALCNEAQNITSLQIEQNLVGRRLVWQTTVNDIVKTKEGDYLVFVYDEHMQVNYVPEQIIAKLRKNEAFNFVGTLTKLNENCFGEIEFNELNQ